jgi:hypothetical protein
MVGGIMNRKSVNALKKLLLLGILCPMLTSLYAVDKAAVELQGWGGLNIATKSTFSTDFTGATHIQPTFGITTWISQPFVLPNELDIGFSASFMPIFSYTGSDGKISSVTAYPILLEARYRLPMGFFAALGAGYAYTRLKVNGESANTNAAVVSLKGGWQYEIMKNLSLVGTTQFLYFGQKLTFPGSLEKSNSQFDIGILAGVAYKI